MRHLTRITLSAIFALLATVASAQTTFSRARADQIVVNTNGMHIAVYRDLQTDLYSLDATIAGLRGITLSPTALSNLITTATANSVYDLILSVPTLTAASVVPLFPTGSVLVADSLVISNSATIGNLIVDGALVIGSDPILGTVESLVASVYHPTNTMITAIAGVLPFTSATGCYHTDDCTNYGGGLVVQSTGIYQASFSAAIVPPGGSSDWTAWVVYQLTSGQEFSNQCAAVSLVSGITSNLAFNGTFSCPMSSNGVVYARLLFTGADTIVPGGGVLTLTKALIKDASGTTITAPLTGGW